MAEDKINRDISGSTSDEELIGYDYYPVDPSYGVPPSGFSWENPRLWLTPEQDKYYQGTIKDIEDDFRMSEESRREQVLDRMNRLLGDVKKRAYEDWIKAIDLYQLAETEEDKEFAIDLMREVIKNSQSGSGSLSDEELLEYRDSMPWLRKQSGSGATSAEEFLAYRDAMPSRDAMPRQPGSGATSAEEFLAYRDAMPRQPGSGSTSAEEFLAYRDAMPRQPGSGSTSDEEFLAYRDAMPRQPGSGSTSVEEFLAYRDAMRRANPTRFGASRSDPNIDLGKYGALGIMPRGSGATSVEEFLAYRDAMPRQPGSGSTSVEEFLAYRDAMRR